MSPKEVAKFPPSMIGVMLREANQDEYRTHFLLASLIQCVLGIARGFAGDKSPPPHINDIMPFYETPAQREERMVMDEAQAFSQMFIATEKSRMQQSG